MNVMHGIIDRLINCNWAKSTSMPSIVGTQFETLATSAATLKWVSRLNDDAYSSLGGVSRPQYQKNESAW